MAKTVPFNIIFKIKILFAVIHASDRGVVNSPALIRFAFCKKRSFNNRKREIVGSIPAHLPSGGKDSSFLIYVTRNTIRPHFL